MPNVNLNTPTDYSIQQRDIDRRRKMAETMQQQSLTPMETNLGPGVRNSWTQGLAKMLQAYQGAKGIDSADARERALGQTINQARGSDMAALMQSQQPLPADTAPMDGIGPVRPERAQTPGARRAGILAAQGSQFPEVQNAAGLQQKFMEGDLAREDNQAARMDQLRMQQQLRQSMAAQSAQEKENMIRLTASLRQPQQPVAPTMTQIVDPTNPSNMISVDARTYRGGGMGSPGVLGMSGKEPAAAKKEEQANQGKSALSDSITTLRGYYDTLDANGAIVNPDKGAWSNVGATLGASGLGQFAGGMVGTKNQTARDSINMQRPLLLQAIKQATGMSAKQMDSNAELKLWLASATDPTKSIQANREALDSIERKYLNGDQPSPTRRASDKSGSVLRFDAQGNPIQ